LIAQLWVAPLILEPEEAQLVAVGELDERPRDRHAVLLAGLQMGRTIVVDVAGAVDLEGCSAYLADGAHAERDPGAERVSGAHPKARME
jgi:hypothetical protein